MEFQTLAGKVAVVTGASSGVGRAIARELGARGAKVGLIARNLDGLEAAAREIKQLGGEAMVLPLDVSDADAVSAAADRVVAAWSQLDIWVNDAMVSVFSPISRVTPQEFRRVTEVNYLGFVHGTLAALRHMRAANSGVLIQIGSALAYRSIPLQSAYCASKAAIRGFTDSLRSELIHERSRIAVCMVQLPAVNTPQFEVVRNRLGGHPQPVPPIYQPEVIAREVMHCILRPRREVWIGWSTVKAILAQRVMPGLLDRFAAKYAWDAQTTRHLPPGHPVEHARDNVDEPIPGDRGARGPFSARSRKHGIQPWLRRNVVPLTAVTLALALGARLAWSSS
ncbi:MAG TPA: SDR family oxidoreductase [Polyangiaceae bacterium]|nr:SDR family oxidoreductase [Polyangiaceae bacterium]